MSPLSLVTATVCCSFTGSITLNRMTIAWIFSDSSVFMRSSIFYLVGVFNRFFKFCSHSLIGIPKGVLLSVAIISKYVTIQAKKRELSFFVSPMTFIADILERFHQPCPSCHKDIQALDLMKRGQSLSFNCPHCATALKVSKQDRQIYELALYSFCALLGVFLSIFLPIILQLIILLASYRIGLLLLPVFLPFKKAQKKSYDFLFGSWKKTLSSFLTRDCPSCHVPISWAQRYKMRADLSMKCPSCSKILRTHPRDQLINAVLLGWFIHNMTKVIFGEQMLIFEIFTYISIASSPWWRSFESLFSLVVWPVNRPTKTRFL